MIGIKKKKGNTWWYSPVVLVIFCILLTLVAISLVQMMKKSAQSRVVYKRYQEDLDRLDVQETELRKDLEYLQSDRGIEEVLRDRYRVVRDGEELIVIVEEKNE